FSFFGMLILFVPLLLNLEYVMNLWLKEVPPYAIGFIRLALISSVIGTISNPLMTGAQATGKIKWYQIIIGSFIFLIFPVVYVVFKFSNNPLNLYWVFIGNSLVALLFRLLFLQQMMNLKLNQFLKKVVIPISLVSLLTLILVKNGGFLKSNDFLSFILNTTLIVSVIIVMIIILGTTKGERKLGMS